jgi:hypothetical protein
MVCLRVVGDEFFSILPKFLDSETLLGTLGDALTPLPLIISDFFHSLSFIHITQSICDGAGTSPSPSDDGSSSCH